MITFTARFAGIDLASSPQQPTAYVLLRDGGRVARLERYLTDSQIIAAIARDHPVLTAIDAPLSLPRGLCCLEQGCSCRPLSPATGRLCERELARLGISLFWTTKRSIIKRMVYRGIGLNDELVRRGYRVTEVYPYASKVRLFGRLVPSKLKAGGLQTLMERLTALIPSLGPWAGELDHHLCDAVIAAYTGYLHCLGRVDVVGDPEEGLISIPAAAKSASDKR